MRNNGSLLFKKYRTINRITSSHPLMVQQVNGTVHITSVTPDSYNVYDARKMNLIFCGPLFDRIDCACQRSGVVYIASRSTVYATERGDVTATFLLPNKPLESTKRLKLSHDCEEAVAVQMTCVGTLVMVLTRSELIITDGLKETCSISHNGEVVGIFHPHTYLNKIIKICRGGKMLLYNISSEKEIYTYRPFEAEITCVEQSPVIDVVAVGLSTGEIHFLNLKTGRVLFSFKCRKAVRELSFGGDHMLCMAEDEMCIFDLNEKRKVCSEEGPGVLSGRFIDDKSLVVSTEDSVAMYELSRYDLVLVKRRKAYSGEVVGVEFQDQRNLLVFGTASVSSISLYRDEQNFEFKYKGTVEVYDVGRNIVCYGERALFSLDYANKNSRFVLRKKLRCLAVYRDFCCLGCDTLILLNLKSKLVHREIAVAEEVVAIAMDLRRIVAATHSAVLVYSFTGRLLNSFEMENVRSIKILEDFIVCSTPDAVHFYDTGMARRFDAPDAVTDYCISKDLRWLGILCSKRVLLYDIVTASLLDTLEFAEDAMFIRFSPNLDFLVAVLASNDIVLLSNKTYFSTVRKPEEAALNFSEFQRINEDREQRWERNKNSFYMELLLLRGLEIDGDQRSKAGTSMDKGALYKIPSETLNRLLDEDWIKTLDKEQLLRIMGLMLPHMHDSMELVQRILFKMLRNRSHILSPSDVQEFYQAFDGKWLEYEDDMLKTIGYLGMEKNSLL
jgi:U3 small nucleolar RNA-associated protein 21